jgi:hypothetical protein
LRNDGMTGGVHRGSFLGRPQTKLGADFDEPSYLS